LCGYTSISKYKRTIFCKDKRFFRIDLVQNLTLNIANIKILIKSEIKGIVERFKESYKDFLIKEIDIVDYTLEIRNKVFNVSASEEKEFRFQGYAFNNDEDNKKSILLVSTIKNAYQYSEEFLLFIFSELCIKKQKLIFHCASLYDSTFNTYIFFGSSGIGKSTIAKKLSCYSIFSDDMVILEKINDEYILHKTPFERNKKYKEPIRLNINGFYKLVQGETINKKILTKGEAFNVLLSNIWFSEYTKEKIKDYNVMISEIVEEFPVFELHTPKENKQEEIINIINNK